MKSTLETQSEQIRLFVEAARLEDAINSLAEVDGFQLHASQFRSRLHQLESQDRKGILTRDAVEATRNKIADDILVLISEDSASFGDREDLQPQYVHLRPTLKEPPFILPQLDIESFTGRERELQQLEMSIFNTGSEPIAGIAGLTGTGGMGKSVLAFHFAAIHRGRFPDGVIGLRVNDDDLEIIAQRFASNAGVIIPVGQKLSASEIMQSTFQKKQALLIFDNAEDAAVKTLRPGGNLCAVIVTTRNKGLLKNLEIPNAGHVDLGLFTLEETRELLGKIIEKQRVDAEPDAVAKIHQLVGGLPLAIRIVGGTLHDQPFTKLAEFAEVLGDERARLKLLRDPDDLDLDVEASFEVSLKGLESLNETLAIKTFACLAACPPEGFSLLAAQAASEQDEFAIKGILGRLVRLSLVNLGDQPDEFILHPLLFLFATRKAENCGWLSAAEQRHTDFFFNYVQDHREPSRENFKALQAQTKSLFLAGRRLATNPRPKYDFYIALEPFLEANGYWSQALDLLDLFLVSARVNGDPTAMVQLSLQRGQFLQLRGNFEEAKDLLQNSLRLTASIEDDLKRQRMQAMVLNSLGGVYQRQGSFDDAVSAFKQGKQIWEQLGDERSLAIVLNSLGSVYQRQGKFDDAISAFEQSCQMLGQLGDERGVAMVLNSLGGVYQRQGKFDDAISTFEQSRQMLGQLGDERGVAMVLNSLGGVYQRQGRLDDAISAFEQSRQISVQLGNERSLAMVLNSLGGVYQRQGKFDDAISAFEQSRQISERLNDELSLAMVLNSLGGVYQRQGKFDDAISAFEQSKQISERLGDERSLAMVLNSLGGVYQRQGKFDDAVAALEQGKQISERLGDKRSLEIVLNSLGGVYQRQGSFDSAIPAFEQSKQISERLGDKRSLAMLLNSLGSVYQRQGRFDDAVSAFEQSKQISVQLGDQLSLAMVFNSLGGVYQRQGRFDDAISAFEQSKQISVQLGDQRGVAMLHNSLGGVYQRQGRFDDAISAFEKSQHIWKQLGDERSLAMVLNSLGGAYRKKPSRESWIEAVALLKQSEKIEWKLENRRGQAMVLNSLGDVYQRLKDFDRAVAALLKSYDIQISLNDTRGQAMVLTTLGGVYQKKGDMDLALKAFSKSMEIEEQSGNRRGQAMVLCAWGKALLNHRDYPQAVEKLKMSFEIDESLRNVRGLCVLIPSLVRALSLSQRRDEAPDFVHRALTIAPMERRLLTLQHQLVEHYPVSLQLVVKTGMIKRLIQKPAGYLYGFIAPDDESEDIYFGEESISKNLLPNLVEGARVRAEIELSARGPRARLIFQDNDLPPNTEPA